jgi:hypothetical protein
VIEEISSMQVVARKEGIKSLTVSIMMKGVNKKKDYSKPKAKFGQTKDQANKDTLSTVSTLTINGQQLTHLAECLNLCYNI